VAEATGGLCGVNGAARSRTLSKQNPMGFSKQNRNLVFQQTMKAGFP
jgi:hypothetical protein